MPPGFIRFALIRSVSYSFGIFWGFVNKSPMFIAENLSL